MQEEIQLIRKEARKEALQSREDVQDIRKNMHRLQNSLLQTLPKSYVAILSMLLLGAGSDDQVYTLPEPLTSLEASRASSNEDKFSNVNAPSRSLLQGVGAMSLSLNIVYSETGEKPGTKKKLLRNDLCYK